MADNFDYDKYIGSVFGEETTPAQPAQPKEPEVAKPITEVQKMAPEVKKLEREATTDSQPTPVPGQPGADRPKQDRNYTQDYGQRQTWEQNNTPVSDKVKKSKAPMVALITAIVIGIVLFLIVLYKVISFFTDATSRGSINTSDPFSGFDWYNGDDDEEDDDDYGIGSSDDYNIPSSDSDDADLDDDSSGSTMVIPKTDTDIDDILKGQQQQVEGKDYYSMGNYLVDDLDYYVEFKTYQYLSKDGSTEVNIKYPTVKSDERDVAMLSDTISREALYWIEAIESGTFEVAGLDNSALQLYIKGYVTYMDENVISVAYSESIKIDSTSLAQIISVNADANSGMPITNTQIINVDMDFVNEFLDRCYEQNGSDTIRSYYSPEEVLDLLQREDTLIIFYTPLGLEIGLNLPYGWTTATYTDYEDLLKSY